MQALFKNPLFVLVLMCVLYSVVMYWVPSAWTEYRESSRQAEYAKKLKADAAAARAEFAARRPEILRDIRAHLDQKHYALALQVSEKYLITGDAEIVKWVEEARQGQAAEVAAAGAAKKQAEAAAIAAKKEEELLQRLAAHQAAKEIQAQYQMLLDLAALSTQKKADYERQAKILEPQAKRLEEADRRAAAQRRAKEQVADRKKFADDLEHIYMSRGVDVRVNVSGQGNTTLTLTWVLFTRARSYQIMNDSSNVVSSASSKGFKRVVFSTGFGESWIYDL